MRILDSPTILKAECILAALLDIRSVMRSEHGYHIALRLSKVIRRQNTSLSNSATYIKVKQVIQESSNRISESDRSYCIDEVEILALDASRSCVERPEVIRQ